MKPHQVTLVPEHPGDVTTTGGLDVARHEGLIADVVGRLQASGIVVSLFVDAVPEQLTRGGVTGPTAVEINTGPYADAAGIAQREELRRIELAAQMADSAGLEVLGGFGAPDGPRDKEGRLMPPGQTDCEYWPEGPRADALAFVLGHRVQTAVRDQVRARAEHGCRKQLPPSLSRRAGVRGIESVDRYV